MSEANLPNALFGQRTLAAIVFTDVVNFSGLVQQNEEHTLRLVQRDLAGIRTIVTRSEGQVLKSTGDGLLIFFNSAVQAVSCSLEIQRWLASEAARHPPRDTLQHRIGIHLGDVFVSETDVMGDGVNIAARLQSEAEPGGICISQTVYDVVKNQLGIKTTYLGPRDLKNIRQAVPVYRILVDAHSSPARAKGRRTRLVLIAAGAGVFAALAGALLIAQHAKNARRAEDRPTPTPAQSGSVQDQPAKPPAETPEPANERAELMRRFDFARLAQRARDAAAAGRTLPGTDPVKHYEELADLWNWARSAMSARTEASPLKASAAPLNADPFEVWPAGDGKLAVRRGGQVSHVAFTNMPPPTMGLIVLNLIEQSEESPARKKELFGAFLKFAREYRLDPGLVETRVAPMMERRIQRPLRGPGARPPVGGPGASK